MVGAKCVAEPETKACVRGERRWKYAIFYPYPHDAVMRKWHGKKKKPECRLFWRMRSILMFVSSFALLSLLTCSLRLPYIYVQRFRFGDDDVKDQFIN